MNVKVVILEPYLRGAYGTGGVPVFSGATSGPKNLDSYRTPMIFYETVGRFGKKHFGALGVLQLPKSDSLF